jgi:protein-S-isoprenylcysteine O-methyltransferase Ste14
MKAEFNKNINMNLKIRMIFGVIMFIGLMFAILFISAGRWDYWHGWFYFLLYSYLEFFTFVIIPSELIKERYKFPPGTKKWDKVIYLFFTALGNINPLIAALDGGRYHWTGDFPLWVNAVAFIIIFLGYSLTVISLWKNRFFSATVRIQNDRGQYVIDKGLYALIRHPGYAGLIISSIAIPIAMNSLWALIPAGLFALTFIIRTYWEDITLQKELPGYTEYVARVRYRLFPWIW